MAAEESKISWAYLVVAYTTDIERMTGQWAPFSQPGDSGSCVFDHTGRVVGIINGGQESVEVERFGKHYQRVGSTLPPEDSTTSSTPKGYTDFEKLYGRERKGAVDITFVTPIDWILDDIKEFTGYTAKII
ncbi:Nucleotide-binding, alpha-beta plait [Metarhizium robertsii ARSEF 23]|nr:Nucleotide-binding, alpha-beta plait [Metarhizium robertsii ARSEF 23]KHO11020.1 Nucleotide-binding, alpha-beta plait [Metarhizium robertsii ARSEF 23]